MSRIHEALKKAEQERAAHQANGRQSGAAPAALTDVAGEVPGFEEAPAAPVSSSISMAGTGFTGQTTAGPFNVDMLMARTSQTEWKPDLSTMLFMSGDDGARGTEEFRTLRSRLYHIREKMTLKTIMITSALPQEGKSFTAANLAQVFVRQHGRRVLLIDGDLRGPRLHLMLGTTPGPGLSEYLLGNSDEFAIMQRGPMENLFFIPAGTGIQDPAEMVGNGRLQILLQRLGPLFDWIIVDSPPAVPIADASLLSKACDGVVMVVRSNVTPSDVARKARQEFPDASLVGVVLNGTTENPSEYAKYYYESYEKKIVTKA